MKLVRFGAAGREKPGIIDGEGRVHPFRIPLSLRTADGGKRRLTVGESAALPPVQIRTIVSTRHVPGAAWQPRRGTAAESVITLLSNAVRARLAPRTTLDVLARAVSGAILLEGPRGDADIVAPQLLKESR